MNAYVAAKEMALHYARKHLAIIKNSEFSMEDKVKLIKIWLRLYNIPQTLANENKNHCSKCGRFSDGNTCDDCQSSASTESPKELSSKKDIKEKKDIDSFIEEFKPKNYACIKALEDYKKSKLHYTADQVLIDSRISIEEALKVGFEETFNGETCYFTSLLNYLIEAKHEGESKRKNIVYSALINKSSFTNKKNIGIQTIIYQSKRYEVNGKRIFIIIDSQTKIVRSVAKIESRYAERHWKIKNPPIKRRGRTR